jgi:phosphatidylinositol alpha-mannosyltransferase
MRQLKVGFILDDSLDKTDGVQQYVLTVGAWMSNQGHEVHYLVGETVRTDIPNVHSLSKNTNVRFNGNRMSMPLPAPRRAIKRLLKDEAFDVLHVQLPFSPWLAHRIIGLAPAGTAIIGTFHIVPHSLMVRVASHALARWTAKSFKRFDTIVSVSPAAAEFAKRTFGVDSTVLANAVDIARFASAQPRPEIRGKLLNVLFVGRLVPRKGCMVLLQAILTMLQEYPDVPAFQVVICGKGPLRSRLERFVRLNGMDAYVRFEGYVSEDDKPGYFAAADVAVFPSSGGESFGIVLVEAMSGGKAAVLGADNVGYHSVLETRPELLFPVSDVEALAHSLAHLLSDTAARRDAAKWCRAEAAKYDTEVIGEKLLQIYTQALQARP